MDPVEVEFFPECANCTAVFNNDADNISHTKLEVLTAPGSTPIAVEISATDAISIMYRIPVAKLQELAVKFYLTIGIDDRKRGNEAVQLALCRKCAHFMTLSLRGYTGFDRLSHSDGFLCIKEVQGPPLKICTDSMDATIPRIITGSDKASLEMDAMFLTALKHKEDGIEIGTAISTIVKSEFEPMEKESIIASSSSIENPISMFFRHLPGVIQEETEEDLECTGTETESLEMSRKIVAIQEESEDELALDSGNDSFEMMKSFEAGSGKKGTLKDARSPVPAWKKEDIEEEKETDSDEDILPPDLARTSSVDSGSTDSITESTVKSAYLRSFPGIIQKETTIELEEDSDDMSDLEREFLEFCENPNNPTIDSYFVKPGPSQMKSYTEEENSEIPSHADSGPQPGPSSKGLYNIDDVPDNSFICFFKNSDSVRITQSMKEAENQNPKFVRITQSMKETANRNPKYREGRKLMSLQASQTPRPTVINLTKEVVRGNSEVESDSESYSDSPKTEAETDPDSEPVTDRDSGAEEESDPADVSTDEDSDSDTNALKDAPDSDVDDESPANCSNEGINEKNSSKKYGNSITNIENEHPPHDHSKFSHSMKKSNTMDTGIKSSYHA